MPVTGSRKNAAILSRPFELDRLLDARERDVGRVPAPLDAVIRIEHVDDARHAGLGGPAPRIAGQHHRAGGAAVVRAVERQHLVAAGVLARDLDRVLVGLGAAVGEEEDVDVARTDLGELAAEPRARLGGHERIGVGERLGLLRDGADDALVAVADVDAHQLAVEVEEPLAFRRPEPAALRAGHRNRIDRALRRPLEERVLLREIDDGLAAQRRAVDRVMSAPAGLKSRLPASDRVGRRRVSRPCALPAEIRRARARRRPARARWRRRSDRGRRGAPR